MADRTAGGGVLAPLVCTSVLITGTTVRPFGSRRGDILIGAVQDPATARADPAVGLPLDPTGRPYGAPIPLPLNDDIPVPEGLVWVLLVGSDARAGEDPLRARADSIHLLAADPATGQATILGFPRDSLVEVPGHRARKINTALVLGGPELLARTVHRSTALPVQYQADGPGVPPSASEAAAAAA